MFDVDVEDELLLVDLECVLDLNDVGFMVVIVGLGVKMVKVDGWVIDDEIMVFLWVFLMVLKDVVVVCCVFNFV